LCHADLLSVPNFEERGAGLVEVASLIGINPATLVIANEGQVNDDIVPDDSFGSDNESKMFYSEVKVERSTRCEYGGILYIYIYIYHSVAQQCTHHFIALSFSFLLCSGKEL